MAGRHYKSERVKAESWSKRFEEDKRLGISFHIGIPGAIKLLLLISATVALFVVCPYLFHDMESMKVEKPLVTNNVLICVIPLAVMAALSVLRIRCSDTVQNGVTLTAFFLHPLLCMIAVEWINDTYTLQNASNISKWAINYLCYLLIMAFFFTIFRKISTAVLLTSFFSIIFFGVANYYVIQFRGTPVLPWDLSALGTAMDVVGGYEFMVTFPMAVSVIYAAAFWFIIAALVPKRTEVAKFRKRIERLASAAVCAVLIVLIFPVNLMNIMGYEVWAWDQETSGKLIGVAANFTGNMQFLAVEKPEGYSKEAVSEIAAQLDTEEEPAALGSPLKPPTIIAVMNESFVDLASVGEGRIELDNDNMPYIRSLIESSSTISGTAYSSVIGGDTCNSEYEFLTGNSTSFLPTGSKPYQQHVLNEQTSVVSILEEDYGYDTVAIHPGSKTAWNRDTAYEHFGFDKFVYSGIFDVLRETERSLVSDKSNYDQVIYEYENHEGDKPLFIFDVTIQNHGGYEYPGYPITSKIKGYEGDFPQTEQFMSVIKKSDDAFREFMDYFIKVKDPVLILFFGDHWPRLEDDFVELALGIDSIEEISVEDNIRRYQVPYLLWANYPLEKSEGDEISLNYLAGKMLRAAGMNISPYMEFLTGFEETFPVFSGIGMKDKTGDVYKQGSETPVEEYNELINKYAMLQYNQSFDAENKDNTLFEAKP